MRYKIDSELYHGKPLYLVQRKFWFFYVTIGHTETLRAAQDWVKEKIVLEETGGIDK